MDDVSKKLIKTFENNDTLSLVFFNKKNDDYVLKTNIKKKLLEIADKFIEFIGIDFFIHDIYLVGSIVNYSWSKYSDVDLHIVIDFKDTKYDFDLLTEFFHSKKTLWNQNHNIKINNYDVEVYVQDINDKSVFNGIYSVLNNKWIKEPKNEIIKVNYELVIKKSNSLIKEIDKILEEPTIKKIQRILDKIYKFRKCGLTKKGLYSVENLTFKYLRRKKYIKKLNDEHKYLIDKELSLKK
jgi:hypothetical protein